ncbi:MAG: DUF4012 domain-containing protein [Propionibacteriales bacterium]|nr:DUF4012 domain-containing protein [Propionibacteriales bacterium]
MGITEKLNITRRRLLIGLGLSGAVLFLIFGWQAVTAGLALKDAGRDAARVQDQVAAGDFDAANRTLANLQDKADRAHGRTANLLWDAAGKIPWVGRNVEAVQTVAAVLDTATEVNAPIALKLSAALRSGTFKPVNGRINLAEVEKLTPDVRRAATSIEEAGRRLDRIRPNSLVFPFNDMVAEIQEPLGGARSASRATATAFDLLPTMLGQDGPRTYLLMVQNPAELRSTGGLPGSVAILKAVNGQLAMTDQFSAADVKPTATPVLKLDDETRRMYGESPAEDFRDINFTPDFPTAAQAAVALVKEKLGLGDIDGVVSVDPIVLTGLLRATGPVDVKVRDDGGNLVATVPLTARTAVKALLNQVYVQQDPGTCGQDNSCIQRKLALQDAFFEASAKDIFDAVITQGQGDQQQAIRALGDGTNQHRILLWSRHPDEQARLAGTAVSGQLNRERGRSPEIGVYLNDTTASKMDYYLQYVATATATECRRKGAQDLRTTVVLRSTMPKSFANLGISVLGQGIYVPQGQIGVNLRIYAPAGGEVLDLQVDGEPVVITADRHFGRQVAYVPITLKPGQELTVVAKVRSGENQPADGVLNFTPGLESTDVNGNAVPVVNGRTIASACS